MDETIFNPLNYFLVGLSAVLLAGALALGAGRADAFEGSPKRRVGLAWWDVLVAAFLWVFGGVVVGSLVLVVAPSGRRGEAFVASGLVMLVLYLASYGPPCIYWVVRCAMAKRGLARVGLTLRRPVRVLMWSVGGTAFGFFTMLGLMSGLVMLFHLLGAPPDPLAHETLQQLAEGHMPVLDVAFLVVVTCVAAPVLEEFLFRGLLQTALLNTFGIAHRRAVIVCAGVLFGLIHAGVANLQVLPALMMFGVILGWLYEKTGSLWPGIAAHAFFNAVNILVVLWGWVGS